MLYTGVDMEDRARQEQERSTERRARILGMDYVDTSLTANKQLYPSLLDKDELYRLKLIPLSADQGTIQFGILTTTPQAAISEIRQRFLDQHVTFAIISDAGYHEYMNLYDPPKKVEYQDITLKNAGTAELIQNVSTTLEQVRADDMLAYLVSQARRLNASDLHIETQAKDIRVRFRIDGVLHAIARLNQDKYRVLVAAIASSGNISTSSNQAQQGHITQNVTMADGTTVNVNLRLETVPTINGMDIVMRLFSMEPSMFQLDKLGLSPPQRKILDDIIAKPTGLVMAVGPTGSGKTTTLYSILNSLNSEERKIITIEDPVEYQFPGITQISVRSNPDEPTKTGFADNLRAVLRLDPDIIMVGEIRDMDTAKTALQAALTGHLVLSTFHAGSAAAALTRLADAIGQNPLFVSAIRLIMAQRLVRRLDDATKQPYDPDEATMQRLRAAVNELPEGTERPNLNGLKLFKPSASPENPYGFKGQLAVREQLVITDEIRHIMENPTAVLSESELETAAVRGGMCTMRQDGILKAIAGETTLEEIFRVLG